MANNSYAQLIDDFEAGLLVLEGESLTDYITRMGGVDYESKANGGIMGYAEGGLMSPEEYFLGKEKYMKEEQIERVFKDFKAKERATWHLREMPPSLDTFNKSDKTIPC